MEKQKRRVASMISCAHHVKPNKNLELVLDKYSKKQSTAGLYSTFDKTLAMQQEVQSTKACNNYSRLIFSPSVHSPIPPNPSLPSISTAGKDGTKRNINSTGESLRYAGYFASMMGNSSINTLRTSDLAHRQQNDELDTLSSLPGIKTIDQLGLDNLLEKTNKDHSEIEKSLNSFISIGSVPKDIKKQINISSLRRQAKDNSGANLKKKQNDYLSRVKMQIRTNDKERKGKINQLLNLELVSQSKPSSYQNKAKKLSEGYLMNIMKSKQALRTIELNDIDLDQKLTARFSRENNDAKSESSYKPSKRHNNNKSSLINLKPPVNRTSGHKYESIVKLMKEKSRKDNAKQTKQIRKCEESLADIGREECELTFGKKEIDEALIIDN